ncbi:MAG: phosphatidate cytidylyltransferase [Thermoleophilia bacterium]|nr:phosphatidate cytidylyltransferase [Thermoleophilia bacterium]
MRDLRRRFGRGGGSGDPGEEGETHASRPLPAEVAATGPEGPGDEPPEERGPPGPSLRERLSAGGGLASRVLVAVPGIAVAIAVVARGGLVFAAAVGLIAVMALFEFYNLTAAWRPLRWAGYLGVIASVLLAYVLADSERGVLIGAGAGMGLVAIAGLILGRKDDVTGRMGITAFGLLYVGVPFGMLVATRDLPHGAAAVANVLVGTWVFDTASFAGGKLWGSRRIAPKTSPGKTLEGLITGVAVGTLSVGVAGLYMDWISGGQSLILGACICVAGFVGDLFESMLKRDVGAKDSGRILAGHGGILDRFDALMFATVTAYFVTVALTA